MTSTSSARAAIAPARRRIDIALFGLALLPFLGTLSFGFIFDDTSLIRFNPDLRGWSSLWSLWTKPYWSANSAVASDLYRPFLTTLFAVAWNAGGGRPLWFHLGVILAHAAATVLVWRLLRHAMHERAALLASIWFAIHPIHVEAVANIANSSEVIVTLATLGLALALVRVDASTPATNPVGSRAVIVATTLYLVALLTKESGAMAAALALLVLWGWQTPRVVTSRAAAENATALSAFVRRWWHVAVGCVFAVICVAIVRRVVLGGFVSGGSFAAPGLDVLTTGQRVWAMLSLGPRIIGLLVWPRTLNPFYGPTILVGRSGPSVAAVACVILCATALAVSIQRAVRGDRRLLVAALWIPVAFFPASNLLVPTGQVLAERTLYLPSVGIALCIGLLADAILQRLPRIPYVARRMLVLVGTAACIVGAVLAVGITATRAHVWGNHERLFAQMIEADSASHRGYWLLGMARRDQGRREDALALLGRAYRLYPHERQLRVDYAETLMTTRPAAAAAVASGLMDWPELRGDPGAVGLYLGALARGFGPDSVIAAGTRLWQQRPSAIAALFLGDGYVARRDSSAARVAYRSGLQAGSFDTVTARVLQQRLVAIER
jgi:hypothetical protein